MADPRILQVAEEYKSTKALCVQFIGCAVWGTCQTLVSGLETEGLAWGPSRWLPSGLGEAGAGADAPGACASACPEWGSDADMRDGGSAPKCGTLRQRTNKA